jgi:hypothetical protein
MRRLIIIFLAIVLSLNGCALTFFGERLEDRTTESQFSSENDLEIFAALDYPPGNIAVSQQGRVFISFHPEGGAPIHIAELISGKVIAYPNEAAQEGLFTTPLSLRIDRQKRLWVLDYGSHGFGAVKLYAFDLQSDRLAHEFEFPGDIAGLGSMFNDFHVDAEGKKVYIADTSVFAQDQAIVVSARYAENIMMILILST